MVVYLETAMGIIFRGLWDVIAVYYSNTRNFSGLVLFVAALWCSHSRLFSSSAVTGGASAIAVCISVFSACLLYPTLRNASDIVNLRRFAKHCHMFVLASISTEHVEKNRGDVLVWPGDYGPFGHSGTAGSFCFGFLLLEFFAGGGLLRRDGVNLN